MPASPALQRDHGTSQEDEQGCPKFLPPMPQRCRQLFITQEVLEGTLEFTGASRKYGAVPGDLRPLTCDDVGSPGVQEVAEGVTDKVFVNLVVKERDPPWYAQPVPLEGCCVLHTPEIDHGAQDEEENPGPAPIHAESPNGFQMLYCGPRFGNGIAPSVFNDGCQGEGMGSGDNAGDKGEALTHEDRRHEAFGSGWGAAVGREVEEAEGEGIREGHVRWGILEDLPQRTEIGTNGARLPLAKHGGGG